VCNFQRAQERNYRHIQRLMKHMLGVVERNDKKREVNARRAASAAQRAAKRDRRALLEASWKSRKEQEIYRRCEMTLDGLIKQIERAVEGKVSKKRHVRDPNKPPKEKKKKKEEEELFCICRTPYDNDRFYIGCECCGDWYHAKVTRNTGHRLAATCQIGCCSR